MSCGRVTHNRTYLRSALGLGAAALVGAAALPAAGQQSTTGEIRKDAREAGQSVERGAERTGERVEQGAERAGQAAEQRTGTARPLSDAWLTAKTKLALLADDQVSGLDVNVDTSNGVVALKGEVESEQQKQKAVQVARSIEGVRQVRDELVVRPKSQQATDATRASRTGTGTPAGSPAAVQGQRDADDQIARQVRQAIQQNLGGQFRVDGDELKGPRDQSIQVDVDGSTVTLKGRVQDVQQIVQAAEAARRVPGVRTVKTSIESEPPS